MSDHKPFTSRVHLDALKRARAAHGRGLADQVRALLARDRLPFPVRSRRRGDGGHRDARWTIRTTPEDRALLARHSSESGLTWGDLISRCIAHIARTDPNPTERHDMDITAKQAALAAQEGTDRDAIEAELLKRFADGERFDLTETRTGYARVGYAVRVIEGQGRLLARYRLISIGPGLDYCEARRVIAVRKATC